ncbi:MAG: hypothetical protein IJZ53_01735 [Tyzzerella sp.]|nr:hypothetical protein [Tyzzerella sp.]
MQIIGLDIGTTSVCGICCDTHTGEIIETITLSNKAGITGTYAWEKLQDARVLVDTVKEITCMLLEKSQNVCSIGITGQMHGIVYLDEKGEPVSPLYTWQDGRGDQPYKEGKTYAEWLYEKTGYSLATGYGAVTHFYNVINGLVPDTANTFCTIHDLAAMVLSGAARPLLHPSDAASFGLYDLRMHQFDAEAIRKASMNPDFFPKVKDGYQMIGKTKEGIPVSVAIGDNQASVLGSVSDMENSILINVGTGSQISCVIKGVPEYCDMDCRPLVEGFYLLVGSSLCGGRAYAILERFLREVAILVTDSKVDSAYPAMNRVMEAYVTQKQPLVVDTKFSGTRLEPNRRGTISNVDIENLTMPNLCDGVMNGMVEELFELYRQMKPFLESTPIKMVGSGNGIRLNKQLAKRFSDIFNMPLAIPKHREEAAFGAAIFGFIALKGNSNIKEIQKLIQYIQ